MHKLIHTSIKKHFIFYHNNSMWMSRSRFISFLLYLFPFTSLKVIYEEILKNSWWTVIISTINIQSISIHFYLSLKIHEEWQDRRLMTVEGVLISCHSSCYFSYWSCGLSLTDAFNIFDNKKIRIYIQNYVDLNIN